MLRKYVIVLPRIPDILQAGKSNTIRPCQFSSESPKPNFGVIVIFVERIQMFRVVVNGDRLPRGRRRSHHFT